MRAENIGIEIHAIMLTVKASTISHTKGMQVTFREHAEKLCDLFVADLYVVKNFGTE